jgi:hypothetical protein
MAARKKQTPKRAGTAFWLADQDGDLLRTIAAAEDRTLQTVLRRALQMYASSSQDYQRRQEKAS